MDGGFKEFAMSMLEIEVIKKLVTAHTLWTTPPYYTNDAQDVIREAVGLTVDTEWEKEVQEILEPEIKPTTLEELEVLFLKRHPEYTKENLTDIGHEAFFAYHEFLSELDGKVSEHIAWAMRSIIRRLGDSVTDKVHRRNLQIADLKKQLGKAAKK